MSEHQPPPSDETPAQDSAQESTPPHSDQRNKQEANAQDASPKTRRRFPIVGIGASAGGLEALKEFFSNLRGELDCAFVVVTHVHREHSSMLPDIIGRHTRLAVTEAADGQTVEPNHVYVSPPGDDLTIDGGVLRRGRSESHTHLPIDRFLRSLAADQHEHAICIILSGTGTDGTLGLRAIKAEAGMAMVQSPGSAKFAGMPTSAENTGIADFVLPADEMPKQLADYLAELHQHGRMPKRVAEDIPADALNQILSVLRMRSGNDFSNYKPSTIRRRIARRLQVNLIKSPYEYVRFLRENQREATLLFRELLITVTAFFRDPDAYEALRGAVTNQLQDWANDRSYRVWVAGCATGEEAYSIAITLHEAVSQLQKPYNLQVFATDLDHAAIDTARTGVYPGGIAADIAPERLKRYFTSEDDHYRINKQIREMVIFAPQNVHSDPPFTRLSLIVCRNLLIYFDTHLQKRVLPTFHYALDRNGLLFLGPSETIGTLEDLFEPLDRKWKIYKRKETKRDIRPLLFEAGKHHATPRRENDAEQDERDASATAFPRTEDQVQKALLARFAPTTIVVEENGHIVYIHGRSGLYLEPAEGAPQQQNVLEMARDGLTTPLATALRRASQQQTEITRRGVRVKTNSEFTLVDLTVAPLRDSEPLRGLLLITLTPGKPEQRPAPHAAEERPAADQADDERHYRLADLEEQLQHKSESLQLTVEELESSNEELKSANEELQSMNEELQSANEELETSKEEMQSLNEELSTVNAELNSKVQELAYANNDMQNLLNSLDVATIFLDNELRIKRYTEQARGLLPLTTGDLGRPLSDLTLYVDYPDLVRDCRDVLDSLARRETEVRANNGQWFMVRILPYRTADNVIEGVVLTFVSIDRLMRSEHAREFFEAIVRTIREPLLVLDNHLIVRSTNEAFERTFHVRVADVEQRRVYDLGDGEWNIPRLRELLEDILANKNEFNDFEVAHDFPRIGRRRFLLNARRLRQASSGEELILLAMSDVTDQPA